MSCRKHGLLAKILAIAPEPIGQPFRRNRRDSAQASMSGPMVLTSRWMLLEETAMPAASARFSPAGRPDISPPSAFAANPSAAERKSPSSAPRASAALRAYPPV